MALQAGLDVDIWHFGVSLLGLEQHGGLRSRPGVPHSAAGALTVENPRAASATLLAWVSRVPRCVPSALRFYACAFLTWFWDCCVLFGG